MLISETADSIDYLPVVAEHEDLASNLKELAQVYQSHKLFHEAKILCRKALALETLFLGKNHEQVAVSTAALASIYFEEGDLVQATIIYKQALAIAERLGSASEHLVWNILTDLARSYSDQYLYPEARRANKKAEKIKRQSLELKI